MFRGFWCRYSTDDRWFFDKSVWQKMFRTMNGCGLNAMVLATDDPFPLMIGPGDESQNMHKWVLENALDYEIAPYLLIPALPGRGEQTAVDVRALLESYPELAGLYMHAPDLEFAQHAVIDVVDAVRPDAAICLRMRSGEPQSLIDGIKRRGGHRIVYVVPYTFSYLVDESPDPYFSGWVEAAGAENVVAEISADANFEPWTSFSYDTAEGIVSNLQELGCEGFALQPLSRVEWPRTSDTHFKLQWQRDLVWYSVWGGTSARQLIREGQPKWLVRNQKLLAGFQAGSRILELLALYFAGDKLGNWLPQFCSIDGKLFTIQDMLHLDDMPQFSGRDWWSEITGDKVVHLSQYIQSGTPEDAYGPEELIEELTDLAEQAITAGEKGMRSASGEKELPSFSRDAFCAGRLGEFYIERCRAALSHVRGDDQEAVEHLTRAVGFYRDIEAVDSSHRENPQWERVVKQLEAELEDAAKGQFKRGEAYGR